MSNGILSGTVSSGFDGAGCCAWAAAAQSRTPPRMADNKTTRAVMMGSSLRRVKSALSELRRAMRSCHVLRRGTPAAGGSLRPGSGRWPDVRIQTEQVGRVVLLLQCHQAGPIGPVIVINGLLVGAIEIDVKAARVATDLIPCSMHFGAHAIIVSR